jgi:ABC-type branched-subunit amino acid transport system substrate-binding protein
MMIKSILFGILALVLSGLLWYGNNQAKMVGDTIVLGQSCALSGPASRLGQQMQQGAQIYFSHINEQGGVHGRKIRLITLDDSYEPKYTIKNTTQLITKEKVFALFGEVGTPTSKVALPIAKEHGIPFLMPFTGAEFLRKPADPLVVNLRNSYNAETEALVRFLQSEYQTKRIAVFYQNDSYGKAGYSGVQLAVKKLGVEIVATGRYRRNTLSYRNALYNIQLAKPDAVIMIGAYKACAGFIKAAKKNGMNQTKFCNISFVGSGALIKELEGDTENVLISQVVPLTCEHRGGVIGEYQQLYAKKHPSEMYDFVSLEGFLAAKLVVKALERAGEELTRDAFMEAFNQLEGDTLEGLEITLSQTDRQALDKVYITNYQNGHFRLLKEIEIQQHGDHNDK